MAVTAPDDDLKTNTTGCRSRLSVQEDNTNIILKD